MEFFANPFQGLFVAATKPGNPITVITDYDYKYTEDFFTAYEYFKQRDYIQLPGELIQASKISEYKDKIKFLSSKSFQAEKTEGKDKKEEKEKKKRDNVSSFDDQLKPTVESLETFQRPNLNRTYWSNEDLDDSTSVSTLQSTNDGLLIPEILENNESFAAFNDLQSMATSTSNFKQSEGDALSSVPSSFYDHNADENESVVSSKDNDNRNNAMSEVTVSGDKNSQSTITMHDQKTVASNDEIMSIDTDYESDANKKNYKRFMPTQ